MATDKKPTSLDFARAYLRKRPKATFVEIRDAAKAEDLVLYPVSFGRAQALEGLVKVAKYGTKKRSAKVPGRGPGRPKGSKGKRRRGAAAGLSSVDGLVETIQNLQDERDRAMDAIEKIRARLDDI